MTKPVLDGRLPALQVLHTEDNRWAIGDGLTDPNEPGACQIAHIWHVIDEDRSLETLATLPLGCQADRLAPGSPWIISRREWTGDEAV